MTEAEWLACDIPAPLLEYFYDSASDRKTRLYGVGCCRLAAEVTWPEPSWAAILASEGYADGAVGREDLERTEGAAKWAWLEAGDPYENLHLYVATSLTYVPYMVAHAYECHRALGWVDGHSYGMVSARQSAGRPSRFAALARDIFGNPSRPVTIDPVWLTPTVVALVSAIYEERAFDRMPVLADALEEAGCGNADILNHCRSDGVHARGCWVVDWALGRG